MKMLFSVAAVVGTILATACAATTGTSTVPEYLVTGLATAGPTCPVMQDPPDPGCADRPVAGAVLLILDGEGSPIAEVVTDDVGGFALALPAGAHTLEPQPVEGLMGSAAAQSFEIGPESSPELVVQYDTGIR